MKVHGTITKMETELKEQVQYTLPVGKEKIFMNDLIGKKVRLRYLNEIYCVGCGVQTRTSFAQGFCYKCLQSSPLTSPCILRPELCEAHLGISRNMDWSQTHCLIDHYVYLAASAEVKVGVTRNTQIPTRWIDQGATSAIILAQAPNRYTAGIIEVALKEFYSDKTSWQRMLKNQLAGNVNLIDEKQKAWENLPPDLQEFFTDDDTITSIHYPVLTYPVKVKSLSFDSCNEIWNTLVGIKGQYLIFDNDSVLNIRKHNGYLIELEF